ncbi:MAG: DHH family phosphoesterase [Desulfocucumaceae bacterium]
MNSLKEISEALKSSSRILLCGHVVPDGDCLGSVAALGMALEGMGKKVVMGSPDPVPETLRFLPGADRFAIGDTGAGEAFDTFVVLDCSVPDRLGNFKRYLEKDLVVVNIDHHVNSANFARYNYLDPGAAATGEILMDLLEILGAGISRDIATCLYTAIVTDTGSFQYENTSPETLKKAARLVEAGIQSSRINVLLYEEKPLQSIQMLGAAIEKMNMSACGKVAWVAIERSMLNKYSAGVEHTDGLINFLRTIKGVEVAILIREMETEKYKVGFRSKGEVDVHRLASKFGGGGHIRASGCVISGSLGVITKKIVDEAIRIVSDKMSSEAGQYK